MARPIKLNADYFSHDNDMRNDPKIKALRRKYGLTGYSLYVMMLEVLTDSDNFLHEWNSLQIELLSGDFDVEPEQLSEVVDYMSNSLGLFYFMDKDKIGCKNLEIRLDPVLCKRKRQRSVVIDNDNIMPSELSPAKVHKLKETILKETKLKEIKVPNTNPKEENLGIYKEDVSDTINQFVKKFNDTYFPLEFSLENISGLKNSILKYRKSIEAEYITIFIFLKTVLRRMKDYNIKSPVNYFMTGCFGEKKFLWQLTPDEENSGSGYHKLPMEQFSQKHSPMFGVKLGGMK
jgi:hypothetical protein